jgi:hypothetical protein
MWHARESRLWLLSILLMAGVLTGLLRGRAALAAAGHTLQHDNVVISEFRTRGPNGGSDEFVELFNPTNTPITITNWMIKVSNESGTVINTFYTFVDTTVIQPGQHYLVATSGSTGYQGSPPADKPSSSGIVDAGGIALTLPDSTVVDQVGMSAPAFAEGTPLTPLSGDKLDQSYERGPGGASGNCNDSDNNAADFQLLSLASKPQNSSSAYTTACISLLDQTISFTSTAPTNAVIGGASYTPTATATSGLPVSFTIDATAISVCSITSGAVSFTAAGTCVIDANQAGDASYHPAPQVQQSFLVVSHSDQTISFTSTAPTNAVVGGASYTPTATATSGLPVSFTIDATATSVCSISSSVVSFIAAGTCVIDANQAGSANYNPAPQVQQSFPVVSHGDQTISFTSAAPTNATVGGASYTPTATATSGLPVSFTIDATATSVCSITSGVVSFTAAGTCVIDANQSGSANYNSAPQVQQSFPVVLRSDQTISFTSATPTNAVVGGSYTPTATATSGLTVSFTIDSTATAVCSISSSVVSFIAAGTCKVNANQAGDATYNAAPQVQQSFLVTQTATSTPTAPAHLVISEFRTLGPNGAEDEFVEIYNPTGAAVNIGGWMVKKSSSCGTSTETLATIPSSSVLLAGQHYLLAASGSSVTGADQTFTAAIADDGGVALVNSSSTIVDQAGMCTTTSYREGTSLPALTGNSNQSYERKPGGATSCYDTDNNSNDFALISPASPLDKASAAVMCAGVLVSTPSSTPTRTVAPTPTRTVTLVPGFVRINEFLPHPGSDWNSDGTFNTNDEYIEVFNAGPDSVNLSNWKLDNGQGGTGTFTLPNITLIPKQIAVFYRSQTGIPLSDNGGIVRLIKPNGLIMDVQNYPAVTAAEQTWCRLPDGTGTWAFACQPTPGTPNLLIIPATPIPVSTPGGGGAIPPPTCTSVSGPEAVRSAECNSPGLNIWGEGEGGEIWLESRGKYGVFVE